ncbi:hypothetical protein [Myxococcus sp. CA040A]|uniref:hypothetical protein n=1 Tax=Myxococcus sp. CA040A TaxID=2741738 RepID=UPI00157B2F43|nr:hypothetical protein [Myxococcus sp. CA040A]NTX07446.1 hypothetical protein [Myxococcus sp. CA040A]
MSACSVSGFRIVVALAALLFVSGCTVYVKRGAPRPNIDLAEQQATLGLVLESAVRDHFVVSNEAASKLDVDQWRGTLEDGFRVGFGSAFRLDATPADLKLQVLEAELSFAVTDASVAAVQAQIRYKARLVDAQGQVLKRSSGTVMSKRSAGLHRAATVLAANAVESLYEQISADFFTEQDKGGSDKKASDSAAATDAAY